MTINLATNYILADGRWQGMHGIARFSTEVLSRLQSTEILKAGPNPLSIKNLFWQSYFLSRKQPYKVFFNPGFNPILFSSIPYVFTIHDLIQLHIPGNAKLLKKLYFETLVKTASKKAHKILTVSEYSKKTIVEWANIAPEKVVVVSSGISTHFAAQGHAYLPGFPYLLHVGNTTKAHKNVISLINAFALAKIDPKIKLICTGIFSAQIQALIKKLGLENRVLSHPNLSEEKLAAYYRGALGVVFPSLYEGFGLPVVEGMASGVPVLTSNVTSLPEIAGQAALLVDPASTDAIGVGIEKLINDQKLRNILIAQGFKQAKNFSWEKTVQLVQSVLEEV